MTSTVHATGRASPFVLTYVAEILPLSESLELKICAIHLHSSLRAMNGVFSRGTDKMMLYLPAPKILQPQPSGLGGDERRYSLPCSSMYFRNFSIVAPPLEVRQYERCQNTGFR